MFRRSMVLLVAVGLLAAGLALVVSSGSLPSVSAHDQTERVRVRVAPFTREVRVRVPPLTEEYRVRVAPFTREVEVRVPPYLEEYKARVAPFTERVRVAPFTIRTVVFPFVKRVRVAPFTVTRTVTPPCETFVFGGQTATYCPPAYTVTEAVFNYEDRPVWGTKDVFNYEDRPVFNYETKSRSVFNYETLTEDVFNYETRTRSVFNYKTVTEDVFNYQWQDRPVAHTHPTPCPADRFDPSTGACWPDPASCGSLHTHNGSACHDPKKSHEGECLTGTELQGHSDCVPVSKPTPEPTPCPVARFDPSTGACWPDPASCGSLHTHNGSACHDPKKSHEGECLTGTELQGHSDCVPVSKPTPEPTPCPVARFDPSTGACWPDPASCGSLHTHNGSACHDPKKSHEGECLTGTELQGHSDCVPVSKPTPEPTPTPTAEPCAHEHGSHGCHAADKVHLCPPGQRLQGHSDCVPVSKPTPEPTPTAEVCAHEHGSHGCHAADKVHLCPAGQRLQGHSDCVPEVPGAVALDCVQDGGRFVLSASWTLPAGARAYWRWLKDGKVIGSGRLTRVFSATHQVDDPGEYAVRLFAYHANRKKSGWVTASATCSALAAPTGVSAVCSADGGIRVSWKVPVGLAVGHYRQVEVEVDGTAAGAVHVPNLDRDGDGPINEPGAMKSGSHTWDNAETGRAHRIRVRLVSYDGPVPHEGRTKTESPWAAVTANSCPRFAPAGVSASCNSHGVVHLDWNPVRGADAYKVDNINYEGDATEVVAQRWEGETYTLKVKARPKGQQWDNATDVWSKPATVTCEPLDPAYLEHPEHPRLSSEPRAASWTSPNAEWLRHGLGGTNRAHWNNPVQVRHMKDGTKKPGLGRDNCSATLRNEDDDGWTRTCTVYWTEPLAIELDQDVVRQLEGHTSSHSIPIIHDEGVAHLYANSDGSASVAPHRHCDKDHDGDGTIDGTCPGPDLAHAPDLKWHTPLPGPSNSWWKNAAKEQIIGGGAGSSGGAIVGAALGSGFGAIAGFLIGGASGTFVAWLHSKDNKVNLVINGTSGCLLNLWQQKEYTVVETFEASGYETKVNHVITYCEKSGS